MKWIKDKTGRFPQRPFYSKEEMDDTCEAIVSDFLLEKYRRVVYPITTDDLEILLEQRVDQVDFYAELGPDVEGKTVFNPQGKPLVELSRHLKEEPRYENRLRTTITHELGHVVFHGFLFDFKPQQQSTLFPPNLTQQCHRATLLRASEGDWLEWQAGYACGAFLMPRTKVLNIIRSFREKHGIHSPLATGTKEAGAAIGEIQAAFSVSADAARVRLIQLNVVTEAGQTNFLFDLSSD